MRQAANCIQYTISNLHIDRSGSSTVGQGGLFAEIGSGGKIENLRLEGVSVEVATNATATSAADVYAGGVAGKNAGAIAGSYVIGTVKATQSDNTNTSPSVTEEDAYAGGIVGHNAGTITSSYALLTGTIGATAEQKSATNTLSAYAGGIAGYQDTGGAIAASYANGTVVADSQSAAGAAPYAGGLVGYQNAGSVKASYSHAATEAKTSSSAATATLTAGGLVGHLNTGATITASYSTGAPTTDGGSSPTEREGGLVGYDGGGAATNSYWDKTASGITAAGEGTGKTTSELQTPTTETGIYANWNIDVGGTSANDDPWDFGTASQYPVLDYGLTAANQRAAVTISVSPTSICESAKGYGTTQGVTYACGTSNSITATVSAAISPKQELPVKITLDTNAAYTLSAATITIAAGSTTGSATVTLTAVNNKTDASDNALTVGGATTQNWATISGASLTIKDEDTLTKPTGVKVSVHGTNAQVDWTATTGATGYTVQWSTSSTFDGTPSSAPASSNTHKITSGLTSGTYHFRVIANKSGYDDSVPSDSVSATTGKTDYDNNNDGLIAISNLAQLNAMRWDLDGDGQVDDATNQSDYDDAFPNAEDNMGCGETAAGISSNNDTGNPLCKGYELQASLDFDTNTKGTRSDDKYWNGGKGWTPIGDATTGYTGEFKGTNFTISNLYIDVSSAGPKRMGLFGKLGSGAKVDERRNSRTSP